MNTITVRQLHHTLNHNHQAVNKIKKQLLTWYDYYMGSFVAAVVVAGADHNLWDKAGPLVAFPVGTGLP